ncbi:hypothetical protein [Arthrobacter sp. Y-9]|uniref:hypothetical protein n=1 Tax=Arthrobacter sp. Y-9 TaxID=3039385 RepID=UPI00241EAFD4|nr:hypothetical protein [Arthrobacter sp. Y-9]WFR83879.1 hypothetical protein P9849_15155 [Arthrobacter sp. Y-9]
MTIQHFLREYSETHSATAARRVVGYAIGAMILGLAVCAILGVIPAWLFWVVAGAELITDVVLTRGWMREDAQR